jgi:hypothetical protein
MPMTPAPAQDLADLINDNNPYYDSSIPGWEMDLYTLVAPAAGPAPPRSQIRTEVDDRYSGDWTFKGEPQRIARAVRVRYRYQWTSPSGQVYWREDYILIGFEGGAGGN